MLFEYDPVKSAANKTKHGIDFEAAQVLWHDPFLLEVSARISDEPRFMAVGKIAGKHWAAIYARQESVIRIISVRRARTEEIKHCEST